MPETHPPTRTTRREAKPGGPPRDPRAADVGLDTREAVERGEGAGFAEEVDSPDTEHKSGRENEGTAG
jgi:hypothetical protein